MLSFAQVYIANGRVVEKGNWAQLMAKKGPFFDLAAQQQLAAEKFA